MCWCFRKHEAKQHHEDTFLLTIQPIAHVDQREVAGALGTTRSRAMQWSLALLCLPLWLVAANDAEWRQFTNVGAPSSRQWMSAVYASSVKKIFTFGGGEDCCNSSLTKDDMFAFSVSGRSWEDLTGSDADKPPIRLGAGMAYDGSDKIYLHGGLQLWGASHDLYSYEISTGDWVNLTGSMTGEGPQQKVWHSLVHLSGDLYSYAGASPYGTGTSGAFSSADMWKYTISSGAWTQISSGTMPWARLQGGMVHANSQGTDYLVIFGGLYFDGSTGGYLNDLWLFDVAAGTFAQQNPSGTGPTARGGFGMSTIPYNDEDQIVIYGGVDFSTYYDDLYAYSMLWSAWTPITPANAAERPPARCCMAFPKVSYDGAADGFQEDQIFTIGGEGLSSGSPTNLADMIYSFAVPIPTTSTTASSTSSSTTSTTATTSSLTVTSTSKTVSTTTSSTASTSSTTFTVTSSTTSTSMTSSRSSTVSSTTTTNTVAGRYSHYTQRIKDYYEWEFRAMAKLHATKTEERFSLGAKLLESLRGDAYIVAQDLGHTVLKKANAIEEIIEAVKKQIFPLQAQEAKELYRVGSSVGGVMSRQPGESMTSYTGRRKEVVSQAQGA
eukprot:s1546_g10.t2